jgi:DNA polymerase I
VRYLVDARYNRETDNPIFKYFNEETQLFDELVIPREDSYSYFLQQGMTIEEVRTIMESTSPDSLERLVNMEYIQKYNLFTEQWEQVVKINMKTAMDVKQHRFETCHEGHIKRVTRYMLDKRLYMGMQYSDANQLIIPVLDPNHVKVLTNDGYPQDVVEQMLQLMFTPVPEMSAMSLDIETETHGSLHPNPMYASTPITSAAFKFYNRDGSQQPGLIFILHNELRRLKRLTGSKPLNEMLISGTVEMFVFKTEFELIEAVIDTIKDPRYPLLLTYFGEGFDLPYIYNRAVNLGMNTALIPFTAWRGPDKGFTMKGTGTPWRVRMKDKMHIDMQQFFAQPTIKNYVFKGKYNRVKLDFVAEALLDRKKIEYEGTINDMSLGELAYYNYIDADLTLELMKMGDFLPLRIIFMFMKLGRQDYYEAAHRAIGHKILNFINGYLTERNILIPNRHDMNIVGTIHSKADIKGKGYKGAIVIDYIKGIFDDIQSLDFGSLYPSMMKSRNISFDTINCKHPECRSNTVPELPHHICTKKMGVLPILVGCIKDIRLHLFKPWSNDKSLSEKDRATYKAVEQAIKVYVNASYGVFGHEGFGLRCAPVAESITAWARDAITRLVIEAEKLRGNDLIEIAKQHGIAPESALDALMYVPPEQRATYGGDTDSGHFKGLSKEEQQHLIDFSMRELDTVLEPEDITPIVLLYKKKNYIKVTVEGKVIVKGMLGKKRNTPPISVACFGEFKELLSKAALGEITLEHVRGETITKIRKYYDRIWTRKGDINDFTFEVKMTKPISHYSSNVQHVNAAKKLAEFIRSQSTALRNTSDDAIVPHGSFIKYVKCAVGNPRIAKSGKKVSNVKCNPIPIQIATKDDVSPIYYHDNLLSVMGQIMEAMNIEPSDIITSDPEQPALETYF